MIFNDMHPIIFAFDFSMAKPAMTMYKDETVSFFIFPQELDAKSEAIYKQFGVTVHNRNIGTISANLNSSELIVEHVMRAKSLGDLILSVILQNCDDPANAWIINESMSYGSKGDATLDLSGYKYVLMTKLYENGFRIFKTYSPMTIKSVAGVKGRGTTKNDMIEKFRQEPLDNMFRNEISNHPESFIKKTAYIKCIDDIVDSYFCLKTAVAKENISCNIKWTVS